MNEWSDAELLRAYAEARSEAAFAELVRRHVDFTYSAALRMVRDPHLAEDVTQGTFIALAGNALRLTERSHLAGWLHRTAQNIASQTVRTIERRRAREQEAAMNELLSAESEPSWQTIAPYLDAALGELDEADRDAILLRYFYRLSADDMAGRLGISAQAAQKRVNRAVERLRELFSKRRITIGAGGLVGLISVHAVQSAPVALAAAISSATFAGAAFCTPTIVAVTKTIAMTITQKIMLGIVFVASVATPLLVRSHDQAILSVLDGRLQNQAVQLTALRDQNGQLARQAAESSAATTLPPGQLNELLRLRGQVGGLKQVVRDLSRQQTVIALGGTNSLATLAQTAAERASRLKQWLELNPAGKIPELRLMNDQAWIESAYGMRESEDDYRRAMSNLRGNAELRALDIMLGALQKYAAANGGQMPQQLSDLSPYFRAPLEQDILDRYEIVPATSLVQPLQVGGDWLITEKTPVDAVLDIRTSMGLTGGGMADERVTNRWQ